MRYCGQNALPLLQAVFPYLVLKREQAGLAIEWLSLGGSSAMHLQPAGKSRRLEIDGELRRLKRVV